MHDTFPGLLFPNRLSIMSHNVSSYASISFFPARLFLLCRLSVFRLTNKLVQYSYSNALDLTAGLLQPAFDLTHG